MAAVKIKRVIARGHHRTGYQGVVLLEFECGHRHERTIEARECGFLALRARLRMPAAPRPYGERERLGDTTEAVPEDRSACPECTVPAPDHTLECSRGVDRPYGT